MHWIVTDNIYREAWQRLLEFANLDLTLNEIVRRHGPPRGNDSNYKKQARQARVCVLQAKEYFDAAVSSSLFTAPNHLYYGMVALSCVVMLIRGDGTKALDFLRQDKKNAHHGLLFSTGCTATSATSGLSLVENSFATVTPNGHFLNWYRTLPSSMNLYAVFQQDFGGGQFTDYRPMSSTPTASPASMIGRRRSSLDLLQALPDIAMHLRQYGIDLGIARITPEVRVSKEGAYSQLWALHQFFSKDGRNELLSAFEVMPRFADCVVTRASPSGQIWAVELKFPPGFAPDDNLVMMKSPDYRETMSHETIAFSKAIDTHEIVDGFMVAYQLSMLSRYFPDLWVACLESHCKAAKLIEQAVQLLTKKMPILALSLLAPHPVTISTHREPWK